MDNTYPPGPISIPENLTKPTAAYKRHAWLAVAGLGLFVACYVLLSGWFVVTAYRLLSSAFRGGEDTFMAFVAGACAAFLAVFMLKALFFVKHGGELEDMEITANEQPRLFAFLHRLADEAGAPRPHRVFLSPRVNAAVFYDLSIVNLLYPSKKNLEIARANPGAEARMLRLAAASDGAPSDLTKQALALPPDQGLDPGIVWVMLGLAARQNADISAYAGTLKKFGGEDADAMLRFVEALRSGANPGTAEKALDGVAPVLRGQAYGTAIILLGKDTPPKWRAKAKQLLFAAERPYFN